MPGPSRRSSSATRTLGLLLLLACLVLSQDAWAQGSDPWKEGGPSQALDLRISLVTFGIGSSIPEWFGHTAVLVEDLRLRQSRLYNYGMFDFGPDMLPKFLMGRLEFWVGEDPPGPTFAFYAKALNRDIRVQDLNLSPARALHFARSLAWNVLPANRGYLYHHYDNNCATRVRDLIDESVGGQLKKASQGPARLKLREHTRLRFQQNFYVNQVLIFWMNHEIDRPIHVWEEMFLPSELEESVQALHYVDDAGDEVPLVKKQWVKYRAKGRPPLPRVPATTWPWMLVCGLGLGALGLWLGRRWQLRAGRLWRALLGLEQLLIGVFVGFPGLVLAFFWIFTDHTVTHANENNFLANPLTFLLLPLGIALIFGARIAPRLIFGCWALLAFGSVIYLPLKALPGFDQANLDSLVFLLPLNLAHAYTFWHLRGASSEHSAKHRAPKSVVEAANPE